MKETKSTATPIWLKMEPEYIDANFDRLTEYLKNGSQERKKDDFYNETLVLLRIRVNKYLEELSTKPLSTLDGENEKLNADTKSSLVFGVKLLGAFLLTCEADIGKADQIRAYLFQQLLLARLCSQSLQKDIADKALVTAMSAGIRQLGYNWMELLNDSMDVLTNKIIKYGICTERLSEDWMEDTGSAFLAKGKICLMSCNKRGYSKAGYTPSLSVADGRVEVLSPNGDKLKQCQQDDIDTVMKFTNEYLDNLQQVDPSINVLPKYYPDEDNAIRVRITAINANRIDVVTTDRKHQSLMGKLMFGKDNKENILCATFVDCVRYFSVGDEVDARYVSGQNGDAVFDITKEYVKFIVSERISQGEELVGRAIKTSSKGHTMWMTDAGVPVYTQNDAHPDNEMAELTVMNVNNNGYIYAQYQCPSGKTFNESEAVQNSLVNFCFAPETDEEETGPETTRALTKENIAGIARALYLLQKPVQLPRERYRILCVIAILCKMTGDNASFQMVDFATQYIRNTIYFAQGNYQKIRELVPGDQIKGNVSTDRRISIVNVLRNYETLADADFLESTIQGGDELIARLAKLVQASNRVKDLLDRPLLNSIKREITKMLSLEDESTTGLEEENGIYLGTEDLNKEFKTSFVYPSNNRMQAEPNRQKQNVFKGICAFLNSATGGTLYLGVNDLGYVCGLQMDFAYLQTKSMDEYIRNITDQAKQEFGLDLMTNINIVPMFDDSVVAIQVQPSDYKIARLDDGKAYIRINAESREMDEETQARILSKKHHFDQDKAKSEFALTKAIENKRKVILHGYSSNNSGEKKDRNVEPFDFAKGHKHVWCYDCDSHSNKLFSIARIGNVEVTGEAWTNTLLHKELKVDLFHMTGDKPIHIILQLDAMARNLLVEEFDGSASELVDNRNGFWILDTDVYRIEGIGRFYIGLASHITIVNAPELKEYARRYIQSLNL